MTGVKVFNDKQYEKLPIFKIVGNRRYFDIHVLPKHILCFVMDDHNRLRKLLTIVYDLAKKPETCKALMVSYKNSAVIERKFTYSSINDAAFRAATDEECVYLVHLLRRGQLSASYVFYIYLLN